METLTENDLKLRKEALNCLTVFQAVQRFSARSVVKMAACLQCRYRTVIHRTKGIMGRNVSKDYSSSENITRYGCEGLQNFKSESSSRKFWGICFPLQH